MTRRARADSYVSAALLILATIMVVLTFWHRGTRRTPVSGSSLEVARRLFALDSSGHRIGVADARVRIVEVGDFTCGACRDLFASIDTVMKRFPEHVSLTWISHAPQQSGGGAISRDLSMAAECAATQGRFEEVYRAVFSSSTPMISRAELFVLAERAGVPDLGEFRLCVENRTAGAKLSWQAEQADLLELEGTPTWFLNGRRYLGAPAADQLETLVIAALRDR